MSPVRHPARSTIGTSASAAGHAVLRSFGRATLGVATCVLLTLTLSIAGAHAEDASLPAPSRDQTPEEVVAIVIDALRTNGQSEGDAGIATVYRFASPGNRANTGPLERFTRMIKRGFSDMLEHESSRFDEMQVIDDKALQAVWLMLPSGTEVGYAFQLGRQQKGAYAGMWMTESVLPLGEGERSGTRI